MLKDHLSNQIRPVRRSPFAVRRFFFLLAALLIVASTTAAAQSGRQRPRPAPEPPKPSQPAQKKSSDAAKPSQPVPTGKILVPAGAQIISQEHEGVTSRYVFKNGITLLVREDHSLPIAASVVYVKAGAANEPEGAAGVSRVAARLLSEPRKGSGDDSIAELRKLGGMLKTEADFDSTSFRMLGPAPKIAKLLELQFKSIQQRNFSAEETEAASKLAVQSNRLKLDDSLEYGRQRLIKAAFGSTLGEEAGSTEKSVSKEQVQAFHDLHYHSGNIIVAIAGDVAADQVRIVAQLHLGAMKPGAAAKASALAANKSDPLPARYFQERADINQTVVSVGYRVPGLKEKEAATFELLSALLTLGRGALLPQALVDSSFASKVAAQYTASVKGGLFIFQMQVSPEKLAKSEEALFNQIENMRRVVLSPGELQRAKSLLEKKHFDQTLSVSELAGRFAFWEARGGYKNFENYVKSINAVTGEQIQQLASQYFGFSNAVVHEYEPRNAPSRVPGLDASYTQERFEAFMNVIAPRTHKEVVTKEEIVKAEETPLAKHGLERSEQATEAGFIVELLPQPVRDFSTLHGPRCFVREDQSRPLLAVGIYFLGGRLLETEKNSGLTELMLRLMLQGTQRKVGADIIFSLEQLGAEVKIVNEPDFFGYTIETLSRNNEQALRNIINIIEAPAFDKANFAQEKAGLLNAARAARDGRERPVELLNNALYGSHPYGLPRFGFEESIEKLSEADIEGWHQKFVKRQLPIVVIVGDTEGSSLVGRVIANAFSRRDADKSLSVPNVADSNAASSKVEKRDRRQTAQVVGLSGPDGKSGDNYAVEIIGQIIETRLLSDMRREQLSFDLSVDTVSRLMRSSFLVYINSAPEQEQRARALVEDEIKRLASAPPSDDEIESARQSALAEQLEKQHAHGERALAYGRSVLFGLQAADIDNAAEKFGSVNKEAMRKALQTYFSADKLASGILRAAPSPGAAP